MLLSEHLSVGATFATGRQPVWLAEPHNPAFAYAAAMCSVARCTTPDAMLHMSL